MASSMIRADAGEILRCAQDDMGSQDDTGGQDDTGRRLSLMPIGRLCRVPQTLSLLEPSFVRRSKS